MVVFICNIEKGKRLFRKGCNDMKFRERLFRFAQGRYGNDQLNNFLLIVALLMIIVNAFVGSYIVAILYMALWGWTIFRTLSRNIYKRRAENTKFLAMVNPIVNKFKLTKNKIRDRKTHVYKKCPHCKAVLRLPKAKGKHTVICPRCKNRFSVGR